MFKNVVSQKIQLFAFDTTTGAPKTGDAANITAYVSKDHGGVTVLGDTSAAEMDAVNAKGVYVFDLTQAETNADELTFTAKSTTANVSVTPRFVSTWPLNNIADAYLDRDMSVGTDSNARSPRNALRFLRNKWTLIAGTLSVKKEDDSTEAWNSAMTSDAAAVPITGSDPA
jgi:hypothetical protein